MKKAVIIPSYNAGATLPTVLKTLPSELYKKGNGVIIVNDCSTDDTQKIVEKLQKKFKNTHLCKHKKNRGYGGALKTGLRYGFEEGFDIFPIVHADGQYAPDMALKLCKPIEAGYTEIVQGSRMKGGARKGEKPMPLSRYIPNRILTILENLVFGTDMAEFHSGYMVYSRKLLEQIPFEKLQNNYNFDAEMIVMAKLAGIDCFEVPIPTKYDEETSSLNPIPYGLNVLKMMMKFEFGHYRKLIDQHSVMA